MTHSLLERAARFLKVNPRAVVLGSLLGRVVDYRVCISLGLSPSPCYKYLCCVRAPCSACTGIHIPRPSESSRELVEEHSLSFVGLSKAFDRPSTDHRSWTAYYPNARSALAME
ncbi:hypothetical protein L227DRAFT_57857 [Lentinus tigrinus ALCF2SS1-6]|uniref:Uncharacterized protein n=1 Tax=Lentinus tigrinus ALCF2SS1-6 TaxID=1328759 RepID=A0A5C2SEL4_9APHY|nr:hypothetical protein L227DRAFT_57857 [Lentinus tigrinus ALCF2SS1-6]